MDVAQPVGTCVMAAIIGLPKSEVLRLVDECRGDHVLEAANFNAPDQVVVSGHTEAVNKFLLVAQKEKRTRAVLLPVSSAFHTPLMESAKEALKARLACVAPAQPRFPVVANVTAEVYPSSAEEIKGLLTEQVVRPVMWEDCVRQMRNSGAETFLEIGPGKVLTGLLKRIDRGAAGVNISDLSSINAYQEASA
jgi:[acyl-carrier-protein] S-malonyltransferase